MKKFSPVLTRWTSQIGAISFLESTSMGGFACWEFCEQTWRIPKSAKRFWFCASTKPDRGAVTVTDVTRQYKAKIDGRWLLLYDEAYLALSALNPSESRPIYVTLWYE